VSIRYPVTGNFLLLSGKWLEIWSHWLWCDIFNTGCNRKVQTNSGHEFHIPKKKKVVSTCVWKNLIHEL
jgi:hypothetical protein